MTVRDGGEGTVIGDERGYVSGEMGRGQGKGEEKGRWEGHRREAEVRYTFLYGRK